MKLAIVKQPGLTDDQIRELETVVGSMRLMQYLTAQATDDALSAAALCDHMTLLANNIERWLNQFK